MKKLSNEQLKSVIGGMTEYAFIQKFNDINEEYRKGKLHYYYNRNMNDLMIDYFDLKISRFSDEEYPQHVKNELKRLGLTRFRA